MFKKNSSYDDSSSITVYVIIEVYRYLTVRDGLFARNLKVFSHEVFTP